MTLPSRITDDEVAALPIDAALDALLTELRAEAPAVSRVRARWPVVVAAAASVAVAAFGVPALLDRGGDGAARPAVPGPPSGSAGAATDPPSAPPATPAPEPVDPVTDTWVGRDQWVLLDAPGWDLSYVDSSPPAGLGLTWTSGGAELAVQWEEERWYRSRYREAVRSSGGATVDLLGRPAPLVVMESQQQFAFLPVEDGYGLYVNASFTTPTQFADLVASLRRVDTATLDAAMPPGTVPPERAEPVASELLADAALPPGFSVEVGGWQSRLGIAGSLVPRLTCGWVRTWAGARADDDRAAEQRALDAMRAARGWTVLQVADNVQAFDYALRSIGDGAPDWYVLESTCRSGPMSERMRDYLVSLNPDLAGSMPARESSPPTPAG